MAKYLKLILLLLFPFFLFWWAVLSPVSFLDDSYSHTIISPDKKWEIVISPVTMTTPLSLIQGLEGKRYITLFDNNGNYIGQSTPFCIMRMEQYNIIFPSKDRLYLGVLPENCDYDIPINEKKWWSKIIGFMSY
ncbi:hypothetical protein C0W35_22255 [Photobacterium kishitanii]|uniref:DUF6201 family protein n=1 Tax=Photobacterium kishitanii TaxID=318456 RepID=UPI000D169D64|nr:DUF6201 family protein [Photobacterium kishitanii]PSU86506.1 hypothetical protein C0W35_22255 [Photobacterium kishitanii]